MAEKVERDLLLRAYGSKAFLKVKQVLEFGEGKVCFSFVDINNPKVFIDIYMDAVEFATEIAHECSLATNERMFVKIRKEKEKGADYPAAIYTSPVGGNATGNNGSPISRYFEISPANKGEVLFTAKAFPAEKNSTGAYIAKSGAKALATLRVPCSFKDLRGMALRWEYLEKDFFTRKFTVENMRSDYVRNIDASETTYTPTSEDHESTNTDTKPAETQSATKAKIVTEKFTAFDNVVELKPGMKACRIRKQGDETPLRLIVLTDKVDANKFEEFEKALTDRIAKSSTLSFTADVAMKGTDVYLSKFA